MIFLSSIPESIRHSKRLTSPAAHIIFALIGFADAVFIIVNWFDEPLVRCGVLPLLPIYLVCGTAVWHWTQRRGRYQRTYFVVMTLLGSALMLAASFGSDGMAGILVVVPFVFHSAVLPQRERLLLLAAFTCVIAISAFMTGTHFTFNSVLTFLSAFTGILAFNFLGRVIVDEEDARAQIARYAGQVEELAAARERNRIAREIHDNLGHYLTAINMQAQAAQAMLAIDPQVTANALGHIQDLAREGLVEARKSITALRELPLDRQSLREAVDALVDESRSRGLTVDFIMQGERPSPQLEIDMTLYRVIQEALTNIHKHAQARHARIQLSDAEPASIRLSICDDGQGAKASGQGFGLLGLRERVQLLGGTLSTRSTPGQGFCVEVEIPR